MSDEIKEILEYYRKYMSIRDCIKLSKIEDYITNLQQELDITNEKWQKDKQFNICRLEENVKFRKELDDYKSRIGKVIKYIKEHNCIAMNKEYKPTQFEYCCNVDLLNILLGEQNEQ